MLALFLDHSKAFDTLDHFSLLEKLSNYGIRGVLLNWCKRYLCNRKQYVVTECVESQFQTIRCGVPQGSILGPLLFLMNDIHNVTSSFQFIQFAEIPVCSCLIIIYIIYVLNLTINWKS